VLIEKWGIVDASASDGERLPIARWKHSPAPAPGVLRPPELPWQGDKGRFIQNRANYAAEIPPFKCDAHWPYGRCSWGRVAVSSPLVGGTGFRDELTAAVAYAALCRLHEPLELDIYGRLPAERGEEGDPAELEDIFGPEVGFEDRPRVTVGI
jgi:hypothetical protein